MPQFVYTARFGDRLHEGVQEAVSASAVASLLRSRGLIPLSILNSGEAPATPVKGWLEGFEQWRFTLVELIMVLIMLGVLAVLALPRLGSALTLRDGGWRDAVISGLRSAHATAMTSQRQVCVNLSTGLLASCEDATLLFARSPSAPTTDTVSLIFMPNGTVTMGDGSAIADALSINILGLPAVTVYAGSYVCAADASGRSLWRISGQAFVASYPTSCPATTGGQRIVTGLSACSFSYDPGPTATQQYGLLTMRFDLARNGETATIVNSVQVLNQP